jgi:hypothetical protein
VPLPRREEHTLPAYSRDQWAMPTCFRFVADLPSEFQAALDGLRAKPGHVIADDEGDTVEDLRGCVASFLTFDRHCSHWYPYVPGLSPKEPLEQLHMIQLERERQQFQERMARMEADSRSGHGLHTG